LATGDPAKAQEARKKREGRGKERVSYQLPVTRRDLWK
jgi:hypothetical protein